MGQSYRQEFSLESVKLSDSFWKNYQQLVREVVIPYQYQVLDDAIEVDVQAERVDDTLPVGKSHALENFRIAAGRTTGEHFGWSFQDSDVYKWLEAVGYSLQNQPDEALEALCDEVIELIGAAQAKDGYLDTYFQLKCPELSYRMLYFSHELYCAGHLIEAAIAYDQATGKSALLTIAKKFVKNIQAAFGYEAGKIQGADGHQEIELALVRLYEYTQQEEYLHLAEFFTDVRGKDPHFYSNEVKRNLEEGLSEENPTIDAAYLQANAQPKNQTIAQGHAVRMLYMATGMAKIANQTGDAGLLAACERIWQDVTKRKMYITAGVGSTVHGEAFTGAYDLPNDTMYCETCASIALVYFAYELFKNEPKREYIEVLERALYNGVLSGASIDGKHFFYVNPLEVQPDSCRNNPGKGHVKTTRPDWFGCACCPPNFARLISSLQKYVYTQQEETLYLNLFVESQLTSETGTLTQQTDFPYENQLTIEATGMTGRLAIRKPSWAAVMTVASVNAETEIEETADYFFVQLEKAVTLQVSFEQPVLAIRSNPKVWTNSRKLAIQRGPFVYCGEGHDNPELFSYRLTTKDISEAKVRSHSELLPQTLQLDLVASKVVQWKDEELYRFTETEEVKEAAILKLIPYHLWGNRGENELRVWFPEG
ncbi:hypothetical protein BAU15_10635 [Enterococcus sp. JM4C]|uniref:glycoside hydrolase family 127 protein n=1 Tax=Candidatus Enterococcus huntleyi TaxID=1857217 RepID=UPI00137A7288|nr:beta-L-arabinofuranosidase domain-containing protein [Enterococcus sp. JM4C]KAF1296232.1 hypothetical protein BAU15_10635 [Enterococcus sp. JM4C]